MKISYDKEVDAIYLKLLDLKPDGVIEIAEGINIDVTGDGKIVGSQCTGKIQAGVARISPNRS